MTFEKIFAVASVMFAVLMFFIFVVVSLTLARNIGIVTPDFGWIGASVGIFFLMTRLHIHTFLKDYVPPKLLEEDLEDVLA